MNPRKVLLPLLAVLASCTHAPPAPPPVQATATPAPPPKPDPRAHAEELSAELHGALRIFGDLVWQRWTTGKGAAPGSAFEGHERLWTKEALDALAEGAQASQDPIEARALQLARLELLPQVVERLAGEPANKAETARAQLSFASPGEQKAEHSERELDRMLTDEPVAQKRAELAEAEVKAAGALAALQLARERAEQEALGELGAPPWAQVVEAMQGRAVPELAALAEETLAATDALADRAVAASAQSNLGLPADHLRRADLPRLVRTALADPEFKGPQGFQLVRATLQPFGFPASSSTDAGALRLDAEPLQGKGARPLALLVDPPLDVRLSVRPAGGLDELRALLHESARALGASTPGPARWELAQLGDGTASLGVASAFAGLAGDPQWLRANTSLRGEPLDDVVHTEATRRLLLVRRACALVLFETQRRAGTSTPEAIAEAFAQQLTRATRVKHTAAEGTRWPLETDGWLGAALTMRAELLAGALEEKLSAASSTPASPAAAAAAAAGSSTPPSTAAWWASRAAPQTLRPLWALGRSGSAEEAAKLAGVTLDSGPLLALLTARLAYQAPDAPPAAPKPDYKQLQGDKRPRHRAKKRKK